MEPVPVNRELFLLPPDTWDRTYVGPSSSDILPLKTLVLPDGRVVSQWQPGPNEIELLKNGVPVTLVLRSSGQVPPIQLGVGGFDLTT